MTTAFAVAFAIAISASFCGIAQGFVGSKAVESIARQPEAAGTIRTVLILVLAFIETLTIFSLLMAFMLFGKM
jgi:F-type H+-transporting ATPase subunit c